MKRIGLLAVSWIVLILFESIPAFATDLDIVPFARHCCVTDGHSSQVAFEYNKVQRAGIEVEKAADGRFIYGLQWSEERDIKEVRARFREGNNRQPVSIQYWFRNWPYPPPQMPAMEDPVDDPWQGKWLKAATNVNCRGPVCSYTFEPLSEAENPKANNLPGMNYRRTLKLRLVFTANPALEKVEVFSGSQEKQVELRLQLGAGEIGEHTWDGKLQVYNGRLETVRLWNGAVGDTVGREHFHLITQGAAKGLLVNLAAAEPALPGSHDVTIVTLDAGDRTFSFAIPDLEKGPVYVPDFHVVVTLASEAREFSPALVKHGEKIREKLAKEPEQTYERASKEIPALDPVERQGGRLYLPLAADASWQKFAFEWGGNITISKNGTKAKGTELKRLEWKGDRISWRIGTGASPSYRPASQDSRLSILENYLPVVTAQWTTDSIDYTEEGFATLLSGPLDPGDPQRNEQTPAVLMLKVKARNHGTKRAISHLWLVTDPAEDVTFRGDELLTAEGQLVRAHVNLPKSAQASPSVVTDGAKKLQGIHVFQCIMLDALGDHALAAEYLETFIRLQGSKPFDGTYAGGQHEVYHGARVSKDYDYTAYEYNLDHGTVLWALGEHYFLTRDRDWLHRVAPSMKKAADWVVEQRKFTQLRDSGEKIPEYGLLPAGHLEDNEDWGHWFSVNAFAVAGMTRLALALADIEDPSAGQYAQEAKSYKEDLREAVLQASQISPVVRLRDNTYVPYVPTRPYQRIRLFGPIRVAYYSRYPEKILPTYRLSATREVLYGPMILLATDTFRAEEPLANWVLDDWEDNATLSTSLGLFVHGWVDDQYWFSRGGMVFQANLQNPILAYLRRDEIPAAIRNLYNDFVSCYYPDVNVFTEEYRQWRSPSGPFYKVPDEAKFINRLRDSLVREDGDALWLAAGVPRRWLAPGQEIEVRNMATYFGPVSYRMEGTRDGVSINVELPSRNRYKTAWLTVRAPDARPLRSVELDGKSWLDFDAVKERIRLPFKKEPLWIKVRF